MIAVTGITGHSGGYFLQELIKQNYPDTVRCLVRETSDTSALDGSGLRAEKITGDIREETALARLTEAAEVVLHIANIHYSEAVLRAALRAGAKRVVLVHTTGIYSEHKTASAEYKAIEERLAVMTQNADAQVIILRPTMIFGDLRDHNISKFIRMVDRLPVMPEIDHGAGLLRPVNARDLGRAYYQAVTADKLSESEYILSGERTLSMHELVTLIGAYLGKKTRFVNCSMQAGTAMAKALRAMSFRRVDLVEKALRMGENRSFPHDAATRDFGYAPEPFDVGLKREVDEYLRKQR